MAASSSADGKKLTVLDSWCSISEKTVFVLDRSRYFTHVSSGHQIEGDSSSKKQQQQQQQPGDVFIKPFERSLWTCAVEAVVGYSRLVWDLFTPEQRSISILSVSPNDSDKVLNMNMEPWNIEPICTWRDEDQNLDHLLRALARRSHCHQVKIELTSTSDISSFPNCDIDSAAILKSLDQALDELSHLTQSQMNNRLNKKTGGSGSAAATVKSNNGRIILISSFRNMQTLQSIIDRFEFLLARKNESLSKLAAEAGVTSSIASQQCAINYCDLVIVNTFPIQDQGPCSQITNTSAFKPQLHVKTYSVRSGRVIAGLLDNLCLQHHNLKSTTITGIPMKEEQSASSSSQYDVEILHCSSIHEEVMKLGASHLDDMIAEIDRNGFPCKTFKLNWCTPKLGALPDLYHCVATSRITSVDVNSRPSACLTNFLLNGKQVMLEIFRSKSNRMTTHVLASHNGELFIHSLATSQHKQSVGDPPSLSDTLGGKVGDYRTNEFIALMKNHRLVKSQSCEDPLSRTCNLIKRQTLYWPLTVGHTILWNVPNILGCLLTKIPKESMTQADVDECKRQIDTLIKSEKDGQGLPSITINDILKSNTTKGGTSKLEQLYKLLWNELEYFLRVHSTTQEHEAVLDYLLERHGDKDTIPGRGTKRAASKQTSVVAASPLKKQKVTNKLIPEISDEAASTIVQQTAVFYKTGMSLFQTWSFLYNQYHRMRSKLTFVGRTKQ